ncbi:hypothetical protein RMQ97_05195 [Maricaulis sp. D1M11]|uniref:hypothetical protein n=1 Tax=Maricaulis sp. D1M11 TaxID=3076117 RepID=UPI0039B47FD2
MKPALPPLPAQPLLLSMILALGLTACSAQTDDTVPASGSSASTDAPQATETDGNSDDPAETDADAAPAPMGTDIYLFTLYWEGGTPTLGAALGHIGEDGYDNQPFFTTDGGVLYTSAGETGNTDIWRHDLTSGQQTQLTNTPDASEYSPKIPPAEAALSYLYQPPGGYAGNAYLADAANANPRAAHQLAPVGYYAFSTDMRQVVTFYLGEPGTEGPFTLQLIDRTTTPETVTEIAENPGRTFWRNPRGTGVYHSLADSEGEHMIHYLDFATAEDTALFALPPGVQDFVAAGLPDDRTGFFSTHSDQLVYWTGEDWTPVGDLSGLTNVTRLALSPDLSLIAIVAEDQID